MPNPYFQFKQFTVNHNRCAMKVTTDSCLFGAWCAHELANRNADAGNVLDVGAGSGLLTLMLAQQVRANFTAVEIDAEAAAQATENVEASPWKSNISVIANSVLNLDAKKFDYIISNPPFYESELPSANAQKNIAHHSQGLLLSQLLNFIATHLTPDGIFFLLLPAKRKDVEGLIQQNNLHINKQASVKQTPDHAPFRTMFQGSLNATPMQSTEIVIQSNQREYTPEFKALLSPYYLYL